MLLIMSVIGIFALFVCIYEVAINLGYLYTEMLVMLGWLFASTFIIDGFLLWGFVSVAAIFLLMTIEYEKPGWCTSIVIVVLAVLQFYTTYHPITFAFEHPLDSLIITAIYFGAGIVWMILKWISYVYVMRDKFKEFKKQNSELDTPMLYGKATRHFQCRIPLEVSDHKSELYMWWLVWPLSLAWTIINDPIKRIWHFIYNQFGDVLQNISNNAFKIDEKLESKPPNPNIKTAPDYVPPGPWGKSNNDAPRF